MIELFKGQRVSKTWKSFLKTLAKELQKMNRDPELRINVNISQMRYMKENLFYN